MLLPHWFNPFIDLWPWKIKPFVFKLFVKSNLPQLGQPDQFGKADSLSDTHLINLLFVQVEHLARTRRGDFFIDFIPNVVPVVTVSSEHKYHLCFLKKKTI